MKKKPKSISKPAVKKDTRALVTALRICLLFPDAGLEERSTSVILTKAGVRNIRHKGYELLPALGALITHFKRGYEARDVVGESDRARKNKAEADAAERKNLREAGELIPVSAVSAYTNPVMIVIRQIICASGMGETEKDDVIRALEERIKAIDWLKVAKESCPQ